MGLSSDSFTPVDHPRSNKINTWLACEDALTAAFMAEERAPCEPESDGQELQPLVDEKTG